MPNRDYHQERRQYQYSGLSREQLQTSPFGQFTQWMDEAMQATVKDPTAMSVATVDANGQPHSRIVLLKAFNRNGFVFYTHYESNKGHEIIDNPKTALLFFWPELDRQIRIEGVLSKTSPAESEAYFHSRPKDSQLAAFTSEQSHEVSSRGALETAFAENSERFANRKVPHPAHWGGYRLTAHKFEFWQGRPNRLHDRFSFTLEPNEATTEQNPPEPAWSVTRLSP
jgi:pyridoxamine-phosphate oxidase